VTKPVHLSVRFKTKQDVVLEADVGKRDVDDEVGDMEGGASAVELDEWGMNADVCSVEVVGGDVAGV
jgi:hypothetical protein